MNRMADINRNQNIVLVINHGGGGRGITISQEISSGVSEYGELESLYFLIASTSTLLFKMYCPWGRWSRFSQFKLLYSTGAAL